MTLKRLLWLGVVAALLFPAAGVRATILFADDFQDGTAAAWKILGKGKAKLSRYQKNISLNLTRRAMAVAALSTKGYEHTAFALSFAALSLEEGEYCIGEVSGDNGRTWHEIIRVGDGQDDGLRLYAGSVSAPDLDNRPRVYIRARAAGNQDNDQCWLDTVRVVGQRIGGGAAAQTGRFAAKRLMAGGSYSSPADLSLFAPSPAAMAASSRFEGRLVFTGPLRGGGFKKLRDDYATLKDQKMSVRSLPDFDFAFVQSGAALVPLRRGPVASRHPLWEFVLEPGRVWREPGDGAFSRAAIPFSLQEKNENCLHNGVMTFLFGGDGQVSHVAVQISAETCLYLKFDLWGFVDARYQPGPVAGAQQAIAAYEQEKSARLAVRPMVVLAEEYPGVDPANFGAISEIDPAHMTLYGVVVDGAHYGGGCQTRHGRYPYCDVLDLPSYSTAKSLVGALALMRMEKLFPGIKEAKIADYVPACRKAGGWDDVTFLDALNMATGHYKSARYMADEDGAKMFRFFLPLDHETKIRRACGLFKRKSRPGVKWVYHTSDTYILGTALNNYLKQRRGPAADIYRDILTPLWRKLGLSPVMDFTRRTYDRRAQPFTGWGLTYHRGDVARLAALLNPANRAGQDYFDKTLLDRALQRGSGGRGLAAHGRALIYNAGFWARNFQSLLGCKSPLWVPFMSGYGGITIALMPNGVSYYYFSDNGTFAWKKAVAEADKIRKLCP
jgi:hypothetical protein